MNTQKNQGLGKNFALCEIALVQVGLQLFLFDYHCQPPNIFRNVYLARPYIR